jgi:hypothetical protein
MYIYIYLYIVWLVIQFTHIYIYCREFDRQVREAIDGVTNEEISTRKDRHFSQWLKSEVSA